MPKFLASYDLKETKPDPHETFLEKAEEFGWSAWVKPTGSILWCRLPNTTLRGTFITLAQAVNALKATRTAAQRALRITVTMEKWFVAQYSGSTIATDRKAKA
jgi:hypothetical protein